MLLSVYSTFLVLETIQEKPWDVLQIEALTMGFQKVKWCQGVQA
jgi:hypothetical protein